MSVGRNISYIVPDSASFPDSGPVHRCSSAKDGLWQRPSDDVTTLWESFQASVKRQPANQLLGSRTKLEDNKTWSEYSWQTYAQVNERVLNFSSGLARLGIKPKSNIGIDAINCAEWTITELSCYRMSSAVIALYDTLGPEAIEYIVNHASLQIIICSADKIAHLCERADGIKSLQIVVQLEREISERNKSLCDNAGFRLLTFFEVEMDGCLNFCEAVPPKSQDLCTIMYTSGTTGAPKGVLLTHGNMLAAITACADPELGIVATQHDVHISYLPLAHSFERAIMNYVIHVGASAGYFHGNVLELADDLMALRPTVFVSVPRLFNRLYDKVMQTVSAAPATKKAMFFFALNRKKSFLDAEQPHQGGLADWLVFDKVKARLGGRVRVIITGSAPIGKDVYRFLQCAFCCVVMSGYGLTETSAPASVTRADNYSFGTVGHPIASVEMKLISVKEMNYIAENDEGEICIRGPSVTAGYYKRDSDEISADGWFRTGDIGAWQPDGSLKIIDRIKNILKLSQGEYVAVETVENVYVREACLESVFVYGDSLESYLLAVVVPDRHWLANFAADAGLIKSKDDLEANLKEVCAAKETKKAILSEMVKTAKESKLKGFEIVKDIIVEPDMWTIEDGFVTPSHKIVRGALTKRYKERLTELYEKTNESLRNK